MKSASLKEIKNELARLHPVRLAELCLQLSKHKKENKELLSYLLFDSFDEKAYIREVKSMVDEMFGEVRKGNTYLAKKTVRKILAVINKQIKFSGSKQTEVELLIHFCRNMQKSELPFYYHSALLNIYQRQVQKIRKSLSTLHEDLQFDYSEEIRQLED